MKSTARKSALPSKKFITFIIFLTTTGLISIFLIRTKAAETASYQNNANSPAKAKTDETASETESTEFNALSSEMVAKIKMIVTAYSSTPIETDDTPFITASGAIVSDGIVANNLLPFGTKIRIPEIYGDRVFIVQDRMHARKGPYHLDIWFAQRQEALKFGAKEAVIEVLIN